MSEQSATRVTLADIARLSGVSRQVVSAVLSISNSKNIRFGEETGERVLRIAQRLNYRPNRTARSLLHKRHRSLGLLIHSTGAIPSNTLMFLLQRARQRDLVLIMDMFSEEPDGPLPVFFQQDVVDGIMVFEDLPPFVTAQFKRLKLPCLHINTNVLKSKTSITFDEIGAMRQAVDLFIRRGCRRLAMLLPEVEHYSMSYRLEGMRQAAAETGLRPPVVFTYAQKFRIETRPQLEDRLLTFMREHPSIDGVVLYSDGMAPQLYRVAHKIGKRIPDDLAVLGISFTADNNGLKPDLTTMRINPEKLGYRIVDMLDDLIVRAPDREIGPVVMLYELNCKDSA